MQLKEKTYYKTRNGHKAYVAAIVESPFGEGLAQPAIGFISMLGDSQECWGLDGSYFKDGCGSGSDLISEWKEPVVVKRYVAWVRDTVEGVKPLFALTFNSQESAKREAERYSEEVLRIDEISYTDG
jgi:hypothetical protein